MKPLPKFDRRDAINEAAEAKDWTCSDCGLPTEEGCTQCTNCLQYQADVENGLFDNPVYDERDYNYGLEDEPRDIADFNEVDWGYYDLEYDG